jgi:hypothetical protein
MYGTYSGVQAYWYMYGTDSGVQAYWYMYGTYSGVQAYWYMYGTYSGAVLCIKVYLGSKKNPLYEEGVNPSAVPSVPYCQLLNHW